MDRDLLAHLPVVLAVARGRGLPAAASELGMSPSAVSHAVQVVERRLGTPLFARTTRSVALTEAGAALMGSVGRALDDIQDGIERIQAAKGKVSGLLAPQCAALGPIDGTDAGAGRPLPSAIPICASKVSAATRWSISSPKDSMPGFVSAR